MPKHFLIQVQILKLVEDHPPLLKFIQEMAEVMATIAIVIKTEVQAVELEEQGVG